MMEAWKRFIDGQPLGIGPSKIILESWERCRGFEVATARAQLRRVPLQELKERLAREAALVEAAKKHLVWALASLEPMHPVIVILTDRDGVVLHSIGNAPEAMAEFGLVPGYDWSEKAMGTNGIGTALSFGAAVAVVGAEHYTETWHNNTCVGAPVRGPDGEIRGAVDISTTAADGDPARLVLVDFLAHVLGVELGRTADRSYASGDLFERASAGGSSAGKPELANGAAALTRLEEDLLFVARAEHSSPAGDEPMTIDALLHAVANAVPGVRAMASGATIRGGLGAPLLFQRALTHLATLLSRGGGAPIEIAATNDVTSLVVRLRAGVGALAPTNNLDRAGVALGEWLSRQLLAVSGATFERDDADGRAGYVVSVVPAAAS